MKKPVLTLAALIAVLQLTAQNLVINPDAESLPAGTGWTIISQGAATCLLVPTSSMTNWTMKPNGTANYPYDHTTGANGGTVFFSGCDTYLQGPFELQQTIDVSADATSIDAGTQVYYFTGYMQTPVSPQTDAGRFIVDFLDATGSFISNGYTSNWQSNFGGSGTGWVQYSNTPTAPAGTRKVLIRLQTQLVFNQPAINVYFDDISLTRPTVVPLGLQSFSVAENAGNIYLQWNMNNELSCKQFEVERSADAIHFAHVATVIATGKMNYDCIDKITGSAAGKFYYRLRMTGVDGKIAYSNTATVKIGKNISFVLLPNPANNTITINGLSKPGIVSIINYNGNPVLTTAINSTAATLDITRLPAGLYFVQYNYNGNSISKKLVIIR